ncbi:MAG: glycine betaine/L-proline ABC transporter ATP-binding protein [Thermotogota bacterium]|nr:glycine betaine/L-proline ABC transporter ATP-binding protein [Thermotogota bacterium]
MSQIKIKVENIYKIFGHSPQRVIPMLEKGMTKDEILNKTGNTVGVNNTSFEVMEGETFVVMGLSGSGKSTLIRCLNRLINPTSGQITVDGEEIVGASKENLRYMRRKKMSMVFQHFALFPHRTVCSNVEYGLEVQNVDKETRRKMAYEKLELVGLKGYEESYPDELSGGMQQRVGLSRSLANDPDILLMDEAFSALDPLIKKDMQDQLLELQENLQKTIVFITHDLDEALKLGDRIAIMKAGKIVQIGTGEEILTNPANSYVKDFVENVDRTKVITADTILRKPLEKALPTETAKIVLRRMRKNDMTVIPITTKKKEFKGVITIDDIVAFVKEGHQDITKIVQTVETVNKDTSIYDMSVVAVDTEHPIAVVDNGRLMGFIDKVDLLSGIIGEVD